MKFLIEYFLQRSLVVNLFTIIIIVVGTMTLYGLQKETFPRVEFDVILISTQYPGSSSEDVEKLVTIELERALQGIDGIKSQNALSAEGRSIIYLEVEADAQLEKVLDDVKQAVDTVSDLPEEAKIPVVRSLNNKSRSVMKVALTGGDYDELRVISKKLRDRLEYRIPQIAYIDFDGYREDEIRIEVSPEKLNQFEVTVGEINQALKSTNLNITGGKLDTDKGDVMVRTVTEFIQIDDIQNLIVRSNDTGKVVRISDVANVVVRAKEGSVLQRSQGETAIFLNFNIREHADILHASDQIKKVTEEFIKAGNYPQIKFRYTDDLSYYVRLRLQILKNNGLIGIVLVFGCLLLFLNFSTSVVTSMGAPIAFMASFVVMNMMGISLNLISMFALILVLGMLVDDSIILAEQFYQKLENGQKPFDAAREAALETLKPITGTILTTIVAFGALFFMGGIMGKFLWAVPLVVIICLVASWLECFLILPNHLAEFCHIKESPRREFFFGKIKNFYGVSLNFFLKRPFLTMIFFGLIFAGTVFRAKSMRFELFPGDDVRVVFFQIKGKVGTPLKQTDEAIRKLEKLVLTLPKEELDQIKSQVGMLRGEHGAKTGSHYGSLVLYLTAPVERKRTTDEILNEITDQSKQLVPDYTVVITKVQGGPPKGKPVEIELVSDSLDELKLVSKEINQILAQEPGVTSTEIDFEEGNEQILVQLDDVQVRRLGLTSRDVAFELRRIFGGDAITKIRKSDEDIEIKIYLDAASRADIKSLDKIYIMNNSGRRIPFSRFAKFVKNPGAFIIRRENRKRIFSVSASLDKKITSPLNVTKDARPKVENYMKSHPLVEYRFGGENEDTRESMMRLAKSAIIAIMSIFFILVVMFSSFFQPLIIMSAIPLGMIGVVWGLSLFGHSLGFMAVMGVVALVGVVVNDSIVLVEFTNIKMKEMSDSFSAVLEASKSRLRPVLLTTFTTVAGLLPVGHDPNGDPFLKPMALSFAYGLLVATFVTLIFVPCNYLVYVKVKTWFNVKLKLFRAR